MSNNLLNALPIKHDLALQQLPTRCRHPQLKRPRLLVSLMLAWIIAPLADAGTLTVTTTADAVAGSVRTAIHDAAAGDTVQ